jgi:leucyl-tRNA synthetase
VRKAVDEKDGHDKMENAEKELNFVKNNAIKSVTRDMESFSFNTSLARIMEYVNAMQKYDTLTEKNVAFYKACVEDLIRMLAPFAPHFAEELWEIYGNKDSVLCESYPIVDESALVKSEVEYAIQVNSKIKTKLMIAENLTNDEIQALVCANEEIAPLLEGKSVKKCIVVKGRLVNLIIG